ncbi:DUF4974 domain-containing protein [Prolixibacteraceae bacterium JC049]|nr:DUF4974 domain-containing protein [Prolixibacteraceae bacterium JC049]
MDLELIWKYIHKHISKNEKDDVEEWVNRSEKHRAYFDNYKADQVGERKTTIKVDSKQAWEKMNLNNNRQRRILLFSQVAAALFAFAVITAWLYWSPVEQPTTFSDFKPGGKKAVLELENGRRYRLNESKPLTIRKTGIKIQNNKAELSYSAQAIPKKKKRVNTQYNTLFVPRGGEYFLTLVDGTKVWLNSESKLKYPLQFTGKEREVYLEGEACFEVAHNKQQPFVVNSGEQKVVVLGTTFNVKNYSEENKFTATLLEGAVQLQLNDKTGDEQLFFLKPNDQLVLNKISSNVTQQKVIASDVLMWREGQLVFSGKTLKEITQTLERWYNVEFEFAAPKKAGYKFTGTLFRYKDIEEILSKLTKTNELKFEAYDGKIIVK